MPDIVPVHYNLAGQVDRYGEKGSVLILSLVATALFGGLTALSRFPHALNSPMAITAATAPVAHSWGVQLLRGLKISAALIFLLIVLRTYQTATGQAVGLGPWFLPVALGLLVIPAVWCVARLNSKG